MVEAAAVHEIPHDPSAEDVAAGVAAADAAGAGVVDPDAPAADQTDAIGATDGTNNNGEG